MPHSAQKRRIRGDSGLAADQLRDVAAGIFRRGAQSVLPASFPILREAGLDAGSRLRLRDDDSGGRHGRGRLAHAASERRSGACEVSLPAASVLAAFFRARHIWRKLRAGRGAQVSLAQPCRERTVIHQTRARGDQASPSPNTAEPIDPEHFVNLRLAHHPRPDAESETLQAALRIAHLRLYHLVPQFEQQLGGCESSPGRPPRRRRRGWTRTAARDPVSRPGIAA